MNIYLAVFLSVCFAIKEKRNEILTTQDGKNFLVRKNYLVFQNSYLRKQNEDNRTDCRNKNDITYSNTLEDCKFVHNVTRWTYEYQK